MHQHYSSTLPNILHPTCRTSDFRRFRPPCDVTGSSALCCWWRQWHLEKRLFTGISSMYIHWWLAHSITWRSRGTEQANHQWRRFLWIAVCVISWSAVLHITTVGGAIRTVGSNAYWRQLVTGMSPYRGIYTSIHYTATVMSVHPKIAVLGCLHWNQSQLTPHLWAVLELR